MISKLRNMFGRWLFRGQLADGDPALISLFGGGVMSGAGVAVNEKTALSASTIFACVRNVAEDEAKLPFKVFRELEPRGRTPAPSHPAYRLLSDRPNPEMTAIAFRTAMMASALLYKGGLAEIQWANNGKPYALWPIEPWRWELKREEYGDKRLYFLIDGKRTLTLRDAIYIPGFSVDGVCAEMVARAGRESIGLALAAQRFAASFYGNGGSARIALVHPKPLSDKARQNIRKSYKLEQDGPGQGFDLAVFEEGMKPEKIGYSPEESQAIESRQFTVEDLCRWFRVPPHKVGHLLRAQGWSTLETTNTDYVIDTLMPWFVRWEQECDYKLLGAGYTCKHIVQGLLRGDSVARADYYQKMTQMGAFNVNDVLELEDRNPIGPEGDVRYMPLNMAPLTKQDQGDVTFKRDVVKLLLTDPTTNDVIYNITDIPGLLTSAGLTLDNAVDSAKGEAVPLLPVVAAMGPLVSGETIQGPKGALVGGDVENEAPADPAADPAEEAPPPAPAAA
jgi:HK97 family phage portal protein